MTATICLIEEQLKGQVIIPTVSKKTKQSKKMFIHATFFKFK